MPRTPFFLIFLFAGLPQARADDGFPGAATPLFLAMQGLHEQTVELLHLPCLREEGYEPLGTLSNRIADLQTIAASETDSYLTEMQKPAPAIGDSCAGSFTTLVTSVDEKRARTERSQKKWTEISAQLQKASDLVLPSEDIRFASTPAAGGGGGAKCIWKAKQLRKAMMNTSAGMALQFKAMQSALESTGELFAIYREKNATLAAKCGQPVPPDPDPAQSARARTFPTRETVGSAADRVSAVTGKYHEDEPSSAPRSSALRAPTFEAAELKALHAAMAPESVPDSSTDALDGFSGVDRFQGIGKRDPSSSDGHSAGEFQSLREVLRGSSANVSEGDGISPAGVAALRAPASADVAADASFAAQSPEGTSLFRRVHACYQRTGISRR